MVIFSYYLSLQNRFEQLMHVYCFDSLSNIFSLDYNLIMKRLTIELRFQINGHHALPSFYDQFHRPTEVVNRAIVPFKIQMVQGLKPKDFQQCNIFVEGVLKSWADFHFFIPSTIV